MVESKKDQYQKFVDAARKFGAGESEEVFEASVAKIAKTPKLTAEQVREYAKRQRAERSKKKPS